MPHWPGELGRVDPDRNGPARTAADSLDEAKAAFRAAVGDAPRRCARPRAGQRRKSGREMLTLSISVDDPSLP